MGYCNALFHCPQKLLVVRLKLLIRTKQVLQVYLQVKEIGYFLCQTFKLVQNLLLNTIFVEYLSKNQSIISILSRSECVLYFANSWLDRGWDNHPQYVIFLWCYRHIVNDVVVVHPLDFPSVLDASLITLENFSTALFCATCIFKYFDFVERSNLQTVTNEFLMDWNAVFL